MTLRERKKARTREALIDAALRLFTEQGFEQTTVEQIAAAADVARRTFFRYFPSKEAVLFPDRERRLERFRESLTGTSDHDDVIEAVRQALLILADDYTDHRERVALQQRIVLSSPSLLAYDHELDQHWEAALAEALGDRPGAPRHDRRHARLRAGAFMGVIRATLREWYAARGRTNLRALGQEAFELLRNGMGTDDTRGRS